MTSYRLRVRLTRERRLRAPTHWQSSDRPGCGPSDRNHPHIHTLMVSGRPADAHPPSDWTRCYLRRVHAYYRASSYRRVLLALIAHGLDRGGRRLGIEIAAAGDLRPEVLVEVISQRDAGRDVQLDDVGVADPVQV